MKDIITDTLKKLCLNSNAKMDTENGRKFIANVVYYKVIKNVKEKQTRMDKFYRGWSTVDDMQIMSIGVCSG